MTKTIFSKVMWVGSATVFLVGLAVILALLIGAASMAFAANGDPWRLGRFNVATAITSLGGAAGVNGPMVRIANNNAGTNDTALALNVQAGEPPLRVNSTKKVAKLNADRIDNREASSFADGTGGVANNADKLDGLNSTEIGVNGLQRHSSYGTFNSVSPKTMTASCPSGKQVVGTGGEINGGKSGSSPNAETDVVINRITSSFTTVTVTAYEDEPTSANWSLGAHVICATAP